MPNIKPCGVDSTDCPACGAQHPHGDGANGKPDGELDASIESCRSCLWSKRIKPLLYDQGVTCVTIAAAAAAAAAGLALSILNDDARPCLT